MAHQFRYLFTPLRVGGLTLKNRIFSSGHAEAMAEDGRPGSRLRAYHEAKARGGAALTIIGGSTSVHPSSPASAWNMVANHDDSIVPAYRAIADAVHRHDCPEVAHPADRRPDQIGCDALAPSAPQLLFTNLAVGAAMLGLYHAWLTGTLDHEEVYLDIAGGRMVPVRRAAPRQTASRRARRR